MKVKTLEALAKNGELKGKRVFIRADLNVPRGPTGRISDDHRIRESLPAINMALEGGAAVMVCSHLGRPKEGELTENDSLKGVADYLGKLLGKEVKFATNWVEGVDVEPGEVVVLENCRGNVGEKKNDEELSKKMAALCDVYVNDAFGTSHRAQATTEGMAKYAKVACAGPLLAKEIDALTAAVGGAEHPLVAVVGGSKVSTKLTILIHLAPLVDTLIVGGGIANTFLLAQGKKIGKSLAEPELVGECKKVMEVMKTKEGKLPFPLPVDVVVARHMGYDAGFRICDVDDIQDDEMILDVGPKTSMMLRGVMDGAKTIIWNGPLGVFEMDIFKEGTHDLARTIAKATKAGAFSIVGGGDTIAAAKAFDVADKVSYISTGGGAFLEFLEGKTLPAVAALEARFEK